MAQSPQYSDDPSIENADALWRRIHPAQIVFDEKLGASRPSSAAFGNHRDGTPMSVILGDDVLAAGRIPHSTLIGHENFSLASLTAGVVREHGQGIQRDPLPNEPAHAEVFGDKNKKTRKAFAEKATWVIPPN